MGAKCEPECSCLRHTKSGPRPCPEGCTCYKHSDRMRAISSQVGKSQKGKSKPKCSANCTCGKHVISEDTRAKIGQSWINHPEDCKCATHHQTPERRQQQIATANAYWSSISETDRYLKHGKSTSEGMVWKSSREERVVRDEGWRAYNRNHNRVAARRGKASEHSCVKCDKEASQWAQVHGTDGSNPLEHYQPMCIHCHRDYDDFYRKFSETRTGYKHTPETKEKIKAARARARKNREFKVRQDIAIREWAVFRYPDFPATAPIPNDIREAWRDYQWWKSVEVEDINGL